MADDEGQWWLGIIAIAAIIATALIGRDWVHQLIAGVAAISN